MDAVIFDPGLPDDFSVEVLHRLDKLSLSKDGPVCLILSATDELRLRRQYGDFNLRFLPKPFDPLKLVSTLTASLEGKEMRRQAG